MRFSKITASALMLLVLIVLNILFFAWTDAETRGAVEWMSYGFCMFSFVVACVAIFRVPQDSDEVYSLTTNYVCLSYFAVQTVLSVVAIYYGMVLRRATEMVQATSDKVNSIVSNITGAVQQALPDSIGNLSTDSLGTVVNETVGSATDTVTQQSSFLADHYTTIVLTVYLLVFVFYAIRLFVHHTANQSTAADLAEQARQHAYIADNSQRVDRLARQITDPQAKKAVTQLYETIHFSANVTTAEGKQIEQEVASGIDRLAQLVASADWQAVTQCAKELNQLAKLR